MLYQKYPTATSWFSFWQNAELLSFTLFYTQLSIKLCATKITSIFSKPFTKKNLKAAPKAEATFPLRKQAYFLTLLGILCSSGSLWAQPEIERQLRAHVEQELKRYLQPFGVSALQQDIAINLPGAVSKMPACQNLQISRRPHQAPPLGRLSYQLSCNDSAQSWQGRAVVQSKAWLNVVVANRTLERDEILEPSMLRLAKTEVSQVRHGLEFDPQALLGLTVRRRITAGQLVGRHLLSQHFLINNGAIVTIRVNLDGFSASTQGTAMENGQLGQSIKVKNNSSGMIIEAIVSGENLVETQPKRN